MVLLGQDQSTTLAEGSIMRVILLGGCCQSEVKLPWFPGAIL